MKTTLIASTLLSLVSTITASKPICAQEGNSLLLPNGTWPHNNFIWGNIGSLSTCQQLCLAKDGCYSYAFHTDFQQCHSYDDIVPLIGFHNTTSGYLFYDICCSI